MATEVVLPQWGMEMQDGTIVKWLKKEGDTVQEGEPLVEIETAKLETELEAIASGVVAHILVPEGATVPIRTPLAIIGAPGEKVPRPSAATPAAAVATPVPSPSSPSGPAPAATAQVVPAARRLAQERGIDLSRIQGTGPRGRVLIEDVERAIAAGGDAPPRPEPLGGMRQTIAARMLESLQTMAQLTLTTEADVTDAMKLRDYLARRQPKGGFSPLNLVIAATARALREHPRMNALQEGAQVQLVEEVNVGVAVSLDEGLMVPTIRRADEKTLEEIAAEAQRLAAKVREGKASFDDVTGGTFTITNLGAYDIDAFTPIINPPQVGILGVGRVVEKPAIRDGEFAKRSMMFLSLTFDHRVIDGAPAAEFLQAVKGHMEEPKWMDAPS